MADDPISPKDQSNIPPPLPVSSIPPPPPIPAQHNGALPSNDPDVAELLRTHALVAANSARHGHIIQRKFKGILFKDAKAQHSTAWLIDDLLGSTGLSVLYGKWGTGKSFLALDIAVSIAKGVTWFGCRVRKPRAVIYIAAEAGLAFQSRIVACRRGRQIDDDENVPVMLIPATPNLGIGLTDTIQLIADIEAQKDQLTEGIGLIVIDTMARVIPGLNENSATDIGYFIANADKIANHFGCAVLAVAHPGKDEDRGIRGSIAIPGAVESSLYLQRDENNMRWLQVMKLKEGEDGARLSFKLERINVYEPPAGVDEKIITSCYVHCVSPLSSEQLGIGTGGNKAPDKPKAVKPLNDKQRMVLDIIKKLAVDAIPLPPDMNMPEVRAITRHQVKNQAIAENIVTGATESSKNIQLNKILFDLKAEGHIGTYSEWIWIPAKRIDKRWVHVAE